MTVSCHCGNICFNKHTIWNNNYHSWTVCATTCIQPCYHNLSNFLSMVEEEQSSDSHDTLDLTSSSSFPKEWIEQMSVLFYFSHFYKMGSLNASLYLMQPCNAYDQNNRIGCRLSIRLRSSDVAACLSCATVGTWNLPLVCHLPYGFSQSELSLLSLHRRRREGHKNSEHFLPS